MSGVKNGVQKIENVQTAKIAETKKVTAQAEKVTVLKAVKDQEKESITEQTKVLIANFKPTAEERIKNAEKFKILTEKYAHLKVKKDELEKFKISSDGTKERIYFENAEGYKLEISNSNIISEMLALAENTLNNILGETQEQVQNFII